MWQGEGQYLMSREDPLDAAFEKHLAKGSLTGLQSRPTAGSERGAGLAGASQAGTNMVAVSGGGGLIADNYSPNYPTNANPNPVVSV